jgi:hypothetical protein
LRRVSRAVRFGVGSSARSAVGPGRAGVGRNRCPSTRLDPSLSAANGGLMATRCQFHAYHLTHWGAQGLGSILRAIRRKGRRRDIALRLVCASLRDHLPACVHLSFPSSKVCRDLACTLASARGAVAPLQIPRAAYVWVLRCTIRRRLSLDEPSPPDGPRQPNIDVPGFS